MGVGIYLHGRYKALTRAKDPARKWLEGIETWFNEDIAGDKFWGNFLTECRQGVTHDDKPALFVMIHPAGEEVEVIVPESGRVLVSAKTSTVGPGYHTALCQLMQRLGEEKKVRWRPAGEKDDSSHDESGYFFSGNRAAVEKEVLLHLKTIAAISVETLQGEDLTLEAWHLPLGHSYSEYPGDVHTPMGVRSIEWVRAVAEDPRKGRDIYPWWEDGLTAGFHLGRALTQMWTAVRWRPVLSDDEYDEWSLICEDLCDAYKADPALDYPWREWAELIDILGGVEGACGVTPAIEKVIRKRAAKVPADRPLIGYRRYPVKVDLLDGWSIRIPGAMAEKWEDNTWSAWDGQRTVWFSNWGLTRKDGSPVPAAEALKVMTIPEGKPVRHKEGSLIGRGGLRETEEDGEVLQNLMAISAVDGKTALCNIFYHDKGDYDWAVATWHSLTGTPATGEGEPEE
jgi:hypothetical protein